MTCTPQPSLERVFRHAEFLRGFSRRIALHFAKHECGPQQWREFIEIFVDTPIRICEARDPKGLYKKARAGQLKGFTGIDDPYEAPEKPELILDGDTKSIDDLADEVLAFLSARDMLSL